MGRGGVHLPSRLGVLGERCKLPQRGSRRKNPFDDKIIWYLVTLSAQKITEKYGILGWETDSKAKSQHNMYFSWPL